MPKTLTLKAIRSLENTIRSHQSYIKELKTIHYRGPVTDDQIATIQKQIEDCENAILELRGVTVNGRKKTNRFRKIQKLLTICRCYKTFKFR